MPSTPTCVRMIDTRLDTLAHDVFAYKLAFCMDRLHEMDDMVAYH